MPQNPRSDLTVGSDGFHGMSQMKSKSIGWHSKEKARHQALITNDPSCALLNSALERFEDLMDLSVKACLTSRFAAASVCEPSAGNGPLQGQQAVVCHARNIAIAHVLNAKNHAEDIAAWVRWLHIAGHETSVSDLLFLVTFFAKCRRISLLEWLLLNRFRLSWQLSMMSPGLDNQGLCESTLRSTID